jgi:hypothetical protein
MRNLLLIILLLLAICSCKSRKLSIDKSTTIDRSVTAQASNVVEKSSNVRVDSSRSVKEFTDKSGTWIWEEWYQADKAADTLLTVPKKQLMHKKTTFIQNDKKGKEAVSNAISENHSELRDSSGVKNDKKDIATKSEKKDLDAKKESSVGWIWALSGLVLVIFALVFIIKKKS